jgi:para-nitrobenzyl esterase
MNTSTRAIADTASGPVEGRPRDDVLLFAGIPYAMPPVGARRFRAPERHEPWREVRTATRFGAAAPQLVTGGLTASAPVRWNEDCLTLNVTTPALDDRRRPVLVWIHGGGYRTGQGAIPWYNGARFAKSGDIVVVSLNYRLGALGFTDLSRFGPDYATSGANGILDQIAALEWVRDNIAAFGGDPAQVTIAGESAGAFSVCTLLASPLARGLFRAAIAQSGGAHHTLPLGAGQLVADQFLDALGASSIEGAQTADAERVLGAQQQVIERVAEGPGTIGAFGVPVEPFYPVEGNRVVPIAPIDAIEAGISNHIPLLTGTNRDETTLWGYGAVDEARLARIAERHGAASTLATYRQRRPNATPEELLIAFTTDHMFRIPAIRVLEARERASNGVAQHWMYWFCWESRAVEGRLRATHALEIPFAFDNLDRPGVDVFLGPGERPDALAHTMHAHWTRFVRDLDPGWERYSTARRVTQRYDVATTLVEDPDAAERRAWDGLR